LQLGPYRRHELLGGRIDYPVSGYTGYGDGSSTKVADFIGPEMRADWAANREALLAFWRSGKSDAEAFPDNTLPWLCLGGSADALPWAAKHLD
jgi:hypothetical protein